MICARAAARSPSNTAPNQTANGKALVSRKASSCEQSASRLHNPRNRPWGRRCSVGERQSAPSSHFPRTLHRSRRGVPYLGLGAVVREAPCDGSEEDARRAGRGGTGRGVEKQVKPWRWRIVVDPMTRTEMSGERRPGRPAVFGNRDGVCPPSARRETTTSPQQPPGTVVGRRGGRPGGYTHLAF